MWLCTVWIFLDFAVETVFLPDPVDGDRFMQASLSSFDGAVIDRGFQPMADLISHRTGLDRLRIAGFFLDAASIAWILAQAGRLTEAVSEWDAGPALLRSALLLLGLIALSSLRAAFRRVGARRGANPLRIALFPHRCVLLALVAARLTALTDFAGAADLLMLGCTACALYLGACATRPPVQRRTPWLAAADAR